MKRAFTLVELLIVVVILATLMAIVVRVAGASSGANSRAITIERLQRMENALSGYYAAYGMYPPVRLQGERNIYLAVDVWGHQNDEDQENTDIWGWVDSTGERVTNGTREQLAWRQVNAACVSQPVACEFPFETAMKDMVDSASQALQIAAEKSQVMTKEQRSVCQAGFDDGYSRNAGRHQAKRKMLEWKDIQIFKFGLLSYLLPRYLVMMSGDRSFFRDYTQWTGNNREPSDPLTGITMDWNQVWEKANSSANKDIMSIANIPSQAVCARWMANFENALCCNYDRTLFGVNIKDGETDSTLPTWVENEDWGRISGNLYNPAGWGAASTENNYTLDSITMHDGWGNDLYYYSPEPYQGYTLWSAGANGRTFPPWVAREKLSADANRCVSYWVRDDIGGLKN